jgi:hypothetical protein
MANYQEAVIALQQQLESAKQALSRDVAAVVASRDWSVMLRDRFDVEALVEHLDQELRDGALVKRLQANADKERLQQRQRGRPRKQAKATAEQVATPKPPLNFGVGKVTTKVAATAANTTTAN